MALWELSNQNKHGNWRSRVVFVPEGKSFSIPKGFGNVCASRFKYVHRHPILPPVLTTGQDGNKYLIPGSTKVHPQTTLKDIRWEKPPIVKIERKTEKFEFTSSSDPNVTYITKMYTTGSNVSYACNCPGVWRSKDKKCKHIKSLENGEKRH